MNGTDAERGQDGWVSCSSEKWSADVEFSNWKKWEHGHWKGENVHVSLRVSVSCLLPGVFPSPPDYQHWRITFFLILSFIDVSILMPVCVCHGWPTEVCPPNYQPPASLSPRALSLAARAEGNSWACQEQCTPSSTFQILKQDCTGYAIWLRVCVFSIYPSFNQVLSLWMILLL